MKSILVYLKTVVPFSIRENPYAVLKKSTSIGVVLGMQIMFAFTGWGTEPLASSFVMYLLTDQLPNLSISCQAVMFSLNKFLLYSLKLEQVNSTFPMGKERVWSDISKKLYSVWVTDRLKVSHDGWFTCHFSLGPAFLKWKTRWERPGKNQSHASEICVYSGCSSFLCCVLKVCGS